MDIEKYKVVHSLEEFRLYVNKFVKLLNKGDIVLLNGDLGVGKTTFVKMACEELGVRDLISSPTFTFMQEYAGKDYTIYHYDLYRVDREEEVYELGIEEYLYSDGISFIEWNKFSGIDHYIEVNIERTENDNGRIIKVDKK